MLKKPPRRAELHSGMTQNRVVIVGGGVIGLCTAYHALRKGMEVTVLDRGRESGDNCSSANAGMIVPSHFIPLAAPGMVAKGLRWMFNPRSPFYIRPSPDPRLIRWCLLFLRHANAPARGDLVGAVAGPGAGKPPAVCWKWRRRMISDW